MERVKRSAASRSEKSPPSALPKDQEKAVMDNPNIDESDPDTSNTPDTHLHRGLRARQVTMIALGGALGSGLLIGTGSALAQAGPGSIFISYSILGFIVWIVLCSLGEMAAWLPLESGFTGYATRFVDPALGFSMGYTYWFKYIITTPNQLTACSLVIQYWIDRNRVNPGVFIAVFLVVIILINYLGIRFFGEIEFWLSSAKVLTMCGLIILSLVLMLGGGPDHDRKGFRYWQNPGAFKPLYASKRPSRSRDEQMVTFLCRGCQRQLPWALEYVRDRNLCLSWVRACGRDCWGSPEPSKSHSKGHQADFLAHSFLLRAIRLTYRYAGTIQLITTFVRYQTEHRSISLAVCGSHNRQRDRRSPWLHQCVHPDIRLLGRQFGSLCGYPDPLLSCQRRQFAQYLRSYWFSGCAYIRPGSFLAHHLHSIP